MQRKTLLLPISVNSRIIYKNVCFGGDSMKVIAKPIEMVSWTDQQGNIKPIRFKISNKDESISVIKVDRVISVEKEKLAGNFMLSLVIIV